MKNAISKWVNHEKQRIKRLIWFDWQRERENGNRNRLLMWNDKNVISLIFIGERDIYIRGPRSDVLETFDHMNFKKDGKSCYFCFWTNKQTHQFLHININKENSYHSRMMNRFHEEFRSVIERGENKNDKMKDTKTVAIVWPSWTNSSPNAIRMKLITAFKHVVIYGTGFFLLIA